MLCLVGMMCELCVWVVWVVVCVIDGLLGLLFNGSKVFVKVVVFY